MWELLGISIKSLIAGTVGGFISLRFFDNLSWIGRVLTVVGGGLLAGYSTPWILEVFEMHGKHDGFVGLMVGLFGMSIISALIKTLNRVDLWEEVKAYLPGRKGN